MIRANDFKMEVIDLLWNMNEENLFNPGVSRARVLNCELQELRLIPSYLSIVEL